MTPRQVVKTAADVTTPPRHLEHYARDAAQVGDQVAAQPGSPTGAGGCRRPGWRPRCGAAAAGADAIDRFVSQVAALLPGTDREPPFRQRLDGDLEECDAVAADPLGLVEGQARGLQVGRKLAARPGGTAVCVRPVLLIQAKAIDWSSGQKSNLEIWRAG
jgi:hypothetical protein